MSSIIGGVHAPPASLPGPLLALVGVRTRARASQGQQGIGVA